MKHTDLNVKELENNLPKEALHVLKILDELENFTAELRKKVITELKTNNNSVHIKLDEV